MSRKKKILSYFLPFRLLKHFVTYRQEKTFTFPFEIKLEKKGRGCTLPVNPFLSTGYAISFVRLHNLIAFFYSIQLERALYLPRVKATTLHSKHVGSFEYRTCWTADPNSIIK